VGVAKSSGDFIALFDSDDLMEPVKLAASMGVFEAHPDVDFVFTAFQGIDPAGTVIKDNWLSDYRRFRDDLIPGQRPEIGILPGDKAYRQLLRANFIGTSSVVCRKKALIEAGPFDESLKNADDIDLWFRLAHHGCTFAFLDEVLHSYRVTKSGVTSRSWQRYPAVISVLKRQLQICDDPDDRSHLKNTLKTKFLGQAWGLRKQGDLKGAETAYRNSLELGFSWQGFLNLHKTQITRLIRNR
jgi:cellulose synthase/poly-beta-1,6-N-acetylglucosamine synthase-like glycosyltransferase